MGERPYGKSLDRIDNSKGYRPGNCRWASIFEQNTNVSTNKRLTFRGETKTMIEWSRELGIKKSTLIMRLWKYGYSVEKALSEPVRTYRSHARKSNGLKAARV